MSLCSGYYCYVPQDGWSLWSNSVHHLGFEVRDQDSGLWTIQMLRFSPAWAVYVHGFPRSAAVNSIIWSYARAVA
jgi:hypothetical protein